MLCDLLRFGCGADGWFEFDGLVDNLWWVVLGVLWLFG